MRTLFLFSPMTIILPAIIGAVFIAINILKKRNEKIKKGLVKKFNVVFKILCCLSSIIDLVLVGFITNWAFSPEEAVGIIIALIIPGILTQCIYFLPYLIANSKGHVQETAIFILNLFAGWTVIAWVIALVWAFTKKTIAIPQKSLSNADEIVKYKNLVDSGIISAEEFEVKKKELLNLP